MGLFEARTVNLQEVCNHFEGGKFSSNTRRVERFFKDQRLADPEVIRIIIDQLFTIGASAKVSYGLFLNKFRWYFN